MKKGAIPQIFICSNFINLPISLTGTPHTGFRSFRNEQMACSKRRSVGPPNAVAFSGRGERKARTTGLLET
jgi:hypothetical protein